MNKKFFYIALFILLGALVGFLVHAVIEIPIIALLVSDFETWGLGLSWNTWFTLHAVWSIVILLLGIIIGFRQGKHWWQVIYVERRYRK